VNFMLPLGLNHIFKFDLTMGLSPDVSRPIPVEWCPVYYLRPTPGGWSSTVRRLPQWGHGAISATLCLDLQRWDLPGRVYAGFTRPWTYRMKSGNTLWQELCHG
jgi:alpha-glucuronidase